MSELRIGLVGTGGIGRTHIERINTKLQGAKVVACADPAAAFGLSVAEKFGIKGYEDPIAMINDPVKLSIPQPMHIMSSLSPQPSRLASMYFARSRWHRRQMPASVSSQQKWKQASRWYRLVSCAVMTQATSS